MSQKREIPHAAISGIPKKRKAGRLIDEFCQDVFEVVSDYLWLSVKAVTLPYNNASFDALTFERRSPYSEVRTSFNLPLQLVGNFRVALTKIWDEMGKYAKDRASGEVEVDEDEDEDELPEDEEVINLSDQEPGLRKSKRYHLNPHRSYSLRLGLSNINKRALILSRNVDGRGAGRGDGFEYSLDPGCIEPLLAVLPIIMKEKPLRVELGSDGVVETHYDHAKGALGGDGEAASEEKV